MIGQKKDGFFYLGLMVLALGLFGGYYYASYIGATIGFIASIIVLGVVVWVLPTRNSTS